MSNTPWLPSEDALLSLYATDFHEKIAATPDDFGLDPVEARELFPLLQRYTEALSLTRDPATRSRETLLAKDTARELLFTDLRLIVERIEANETVSPTAKWSLGLEVVEQKRALAPVSTLSAKPLVNLINIASSRHIIHLCDEADPRKRSWPSGMKGAQIYTFVAPAGMSPPSDLEEWTFKGVATKSEFKIRYNPHEAGKQAYIVARWFNRKGETGPHSLPMVAPVAA